MIRYLILITFLLFPTFAFSQDPSLRPVVSGKKLNEHSTKTDNTSSAYNRGTEQSPIFIREVRPEPSEEVRRAEAKEHNLRASYEYWTVVSTVIIAAFTVVMGIWNILLWRESKRTANFTGQTAETMRDTAMQELRAYVYTKHDDEPVISLDVSNRLSMATKIINFGMTPAHDLMICSRYGIYPLPLTSINQLDAFHYDVDAPKSPLAPGEAVYLRASIPEILSEDVIADIKSEKAALFIYGEIKYFDIFNKPHKTKYCFISTGEDFLDKTLAYYHQGNYAD